MCKITDSHKTKAGVKRDFRFQRLWIRNDLSGSSYKILEFRILILEKFPYGFEPVIFRFTVCNVRTRHDKYKLRNIEIGDIRTVTNMNQRGGRIHNLTS